MSNHVDAVGVGGTTDTSGRHSTHADEGPLDRGPGCAD